MELAIYLERLDLSRGGAERSTWEMACALSDQGAAVTVVAGEQVTENLGRDDVEVNSLGVKSLTRGGWWDRYAAAAEDHAAGGGYDIVHSIVPLDFADVYQPRGGSMTHIARRHAEAAGGGGQVRFKRATGWMNRGRQKRIEAERRLCALEGGPIVAALSGYVAEQFRRDYQLAEQRIALVRNGVKVDRFCAEATVERAGVMRELADPDDRLALLLYVGANFQRKGLDWLIRAAARAVELNRTDRDFRIMVVSPDDFTAYWELARDLKVHDRVLFMGRSSEVPALYVMADSVVLPTRDDACSRVVMEGLAAGTPAITTRYNGAADFLDEGRYGIIVENCDDDRELAEGIVSMCDREQCRSYKSRIKADELYRTVSMARHAEELMALYERLLAEKG